MEGPGERADPPCPDLIGGWVRRWGKPAKEVRKKAPKQYERTGYLLCNQQT